MMKLKDVSAIALFTMAEASLLSKIGDNGAKNKTKKMSCCQD